MIALRLLLPALSLLVLGAHFFRNSITLLLAAVIVFLALLPVRRPWVGRAIPIALLLGAIEWVRTLAAIAATRMRSGEPWVRLVVILGGVAVVTALSSLIFRTAAVRRWYAGGRPVGGDATEPPA
jgi:hypothetical protein